MTEPEIFAGGIFTCETHPPILCNPVSEDNSCVGAMVPCMTCDKSLLSFVVKRMRSLGILHLVVILPLQKILSDHPWVLHFLLPNSCCYLM